MQTFKSAIPTMNRLYTEDGRLPESNPTRQKNMSQIPDQRNSDPALIFEHKEHLTSLLGTIEKTLSTKEKLVFFSRCADKTFKEIEEQTGVPASSAERAHKKARRKLRIACLRQDLHR